MKSSINNVVLGLLVVALASASVFGKTRRERVTFGSDLTVNGTFVKSGAYDVVFDEKAGELSIVKGNKVVAKVMVRVEQRDDKARATQTRTIREGNEIELLGITFGGTSQDVVVTNPSMQSSGNN
jgi:hypothetical protein